MTTSHIDLTKAVNPTMVRLMKIYNVYCHHGSIILMSMLLAIVILHQWINVQSQHYFVASINTVILCNELLLLHNVPIMGFYFSYTSTIS